MLLNIAKYLKTLRCGCGAVAFIFSILLKPVLYLSLTIPRHISLFDLKFVCYILELLVRLYILFVTVLFGLTCVLYVVFFYSLIYSQISISRSCWDYYNKFELPEVKINFHFGYFRLKKRVPATMIRFEKVFLIEIDYFELKHISHEFDIHPSSRYQCSPVMPFETLMMFIT